MTSNFARGMAVVTSLAVAAPSPTTFAQSLKPAAVVVEASATRFNVAQLDSLLAPIALYPDPLLTQVLMASTFPLNVVAASRWLQADDNKNLKNDAGEGFGGTKLGSERQINRPISPGRRDA
jgi:hypothetical protein